MFGFQTDYWVNMGNVKELEQIIAHAVWGKQRRKMKSRGAVRVSGCSSPGGLSAGRCHCARG